MLIPHKRENKCEELCDSDYEWKDEEGQTVKTKEDDSNKLLIDDISGDEALSFWSRIAARHIHQPRIVNL